METGHPDNSMPDDPLPRPDPSSLKGLTMALGFEPAEPGHDPLLGRDIGGVTLVRLIAEGGMGRVYEGLQEKPRRPVAVKVIRPGFGSSQLARRFHLEIEVLARLQHPFIAQIYSAGMCDVVGAKVPFFVMEFVPDALSITRYAKEKALSTKDRLALFRKTCEAVAHGHHNGVIHRDLKPGNILVDRTGTPKVIDFGVARCIDAKPEQMTALTDMGQLIGTLQYMSPEQIAADPTKVDVRTDVYALGVILYELLTGQRPYEISQKQIFDAMRVVQETKPIAPSRLNREITSDLERISGKCLYKSHNRRFANAAALVDAIDSYVGGGRVGANDPGWNSTVNDVFEHIDKQPTFRQRAAFPALIIAAALLVCGLVALRALTPSQKESRPQTGLSKRAFTEIPGTEQPGQALARAAMQRDADEPPTKSNLAQGNPADTTKFDDFEAKQLDGWTWNGDEGSRVKAMPPSIRVAIAKAQAVAVDNQRCVVTGRVQDEKGDPAKGEIFVTEGNGSPLARTMDGGWFVLVLEQCDRKVSPVKLLAGGFSHETTTFTVPITVGKVTLADCVVRRPAKDSLCTIRGKITDKQGAPIPNATVSLGSDLTGGWSVGPRTKTDGDGAYEISNLASRQYTVTAKSGLTYESDWSTVALPAGNTAEVPFILIKTQKVTIDYVFQPDESRAFDGDNIQSGQLVFRRPNFGFLFAEGRAHNEAGVKDDLRLECKKGELLFRNFMCNGSNGFYDAGLVEFQGMKEARQEGYAIHPVPCIVGHVYVVRTYGGRYAKFVVRSIEDDRIRN